MATKLLLVDDVEDLGRSGDIVSVKPGYARNYLIPRGSAIIADKRALRMQARLQEERKKRAIAERQEAEELAARFVDVNVTTVVKVDHDGHMYGSVSAVDISHLLEEQAGLKVEKRFIQLKHPIRETGVHTINLKLKEGITASFKLKIVPEEVHGHGHAPRAGAGAGAEEQPAE